MSAAACKNIALGGREGERERCSTCDIRRFPDSVCLPPQKERPVQKIGGVRPSFFSRADKWEFTLCLLCTLRKPPWPQGEGPKCKEEEFPWGRMIRPWI